MPSGDAGEPSSEAVGFSSAVVEPDQRTEVFIVRGDEPLLRPGESDFGVDNVGWGRLAIAIAVPHQAEVLDCLDDGGPIPLDAALGGRRRDVGHRHLECHLIEDCPCVGEGLLNLGVRGAQRSLSPARRVERHIDVQADSFLRTGGDVRAADHADAAAGVDFGQKVSRDRFAAELGRCHRLAGDRNLGTLSCCDLETLHQRKVERGLGVPRDE